MLLSKGYGPSSLAYVASMVPFLPGSIGSLVHFTAVHPQLEMTA